MLSRREFPLVSALAALLLIAGCASNRGATSTAQLRSGDSPTVALQGVPNPSTNSVQIDEQGLISLPYIGTLTAAGGTTADLSQRIRETYVTRKI